MTEHLIEYLKFFVGFPYRYGGKNPLTGFDCSGLICEGLMSVGALPFGSVFNAQQLYDRFSAQSQATVIAAEGNLVFFGKGAKAVDHVGLCIGDGLMIEAGGGTPDCTTDAIAAGHSAFVKIRPIHYRRDFFQIVSLQSILMEPHLP